MSTIAVSAIAAAVVLVVLACWPRRAERATRPGWWPLTEDEEREMDRITARHRHPCRDQEGPS